MTEWKIPESIIVKFGLVNEGTTIYDSFAHDCRIFVMPEIGDVYFMECDHSGKPMVNETITILFTGRLKRGSCVVTHDFLNDMDRKTFLKYINDQLRLV